MDFYTSDDFLFIAYEAIEIYSEAVVYGFEFFW